MGRKRRSVKPVDTIWAIPDPLWEEVLQPLLEQTYPPARTTSRRSASRAQRHHLSNANRLSVEPLALRVRLG